MGTRRELFSFAFSNRFPKRTVWKKRTDDLNTKKGTKKNLDGRSVSRKNPVGILIFVTKGGYLFWQAVLFFRPIFSAIGLSLW